MSEVPAPGPAILYPASATGFAIVGAAAAANLLPWGFGMTWALSVAGSVAVILATEEGLHGLPSLRTLRARHDVRRAALRGILAVSLPASLILLPDLLALLASWAPEEMVLARTFQLVAPYALLAFLMTLHAYFPMILTAALDHDPFAPFFRLHRKQHAADLISIRLLAYAGILGAYAFRWVLAATGAPAPVNQLLGAAAFVWIHLALARVAAMLSLERRRSRGAS